MDRRVVLSASKLFPGQCTIATSSKRKLQLILAAALIVSSEGAHVGQVVVDEMSLEALSASAPIIVIARRTSDTPYTFATDDIVVGPDNEEEHVSYTFTVWPFEIIESIKYRNQSPLESRIGVTQANIQQDYEVYLDSLRGLSVTYSQTRYRAEPELTLESVGAEPVVLFLNRGYVRTDNVSQELADAYQLYAANSLEHLARKEDIATLSTAPYDDSTGPSRPLPVDDE